MLSVTVTTRIIEDRTDLLIALEEAKELSSALYGLLGKVTRAGALTDSLDFYYRCIEGLQESLDSRLEELAEEVAMPEPVIVDYDLD